MIVGRKWFGKLMASEFLQVIVSSGDGKKAEYSVSIVNDEGWDVSVLWCTTVIVS